MRWANYIGNRCFAIFLSILINKPISDSLCGTKVFSRKFFNLIKKMVVGNQSQILLAIFQ